jgi:hypothetical protein
MVKVVPVTFSMEVVVPGHVVVMVVVPVVSARMVIPMAGVVPRMPAPVAVVIRMVGIPAVMAVVPTMPPVVSMRISNIEVHAASTDMDPLGLCFVDFDGSKTRGQHSRT